MRIASIALAGVVLTLQSCLQLPPQLHESEQKELEASAAAMLDDFHDAASKADTNRYFNHFEEDAVFLGTDATERWTRAEFEDYVRPYFAQGKGWTYRAVERHVHVAGDGRYAWFDERLMNEKYGETRGTGVMVRRAKEWRIAQYDLTIPIPNGIAEEVVGRIRAGK